MIFKSLNIQPAINFIHGTFLFALMVLVSLGSVLVWDKAFAFSPIDARYAIQLGPTVVHTEMPSEQTYIKEDFTEYPGYVELPPPPKPPEYVFIVDRSAQTMAIIKDDQPVSNHKVIVGKQGRSTPIMTTDFDLLSINPVWDVPDIVVPDLIAKFQRMRNPQPYIKRMGYYFVNQNGEEISPDTIPWKDLTTENIWFKIKQHPGDQNMLGEVLFALNAETSNDVRMHSTANPELFNKEDRRFSSGCIRVDGIGSIAADLLQKTRSEYAQLLASDQNQWFRLPYKVTVKIVD